jgi:hypothetical protein
MLRRNFLAGLASSTIAVPVRETSNKRLRDALDNLKRALMSDPAIGNFEVHYNPHSPTVIVVAAFRKALTSAPEEDGHNI